MLSRYFLISEQLIITFLFVSSGSLYIDRIEFCVPKKKKKKIFLLIIVIFHPRKMVRIFYLVSGKYSLDTSSKKLSNTKFGLSTLFLGSELFCSLSRPMFYTQMLFWRLLMLNQSRAHVIVLPDLALLALILAINVRFGYSFTHRYTVVDPELHFWRGGGILIFSKHGKC